MLCCLDTEILSACSVKRPCHVSDEFDAGCSWDLTLRKVCWICRPTIDTKPHTLIFIAIPLCGSYPTTLKSSTLQPSILHPASFSISRVGKSFGTLSI